jgi:hypothetical protein
MAVIRSPRRLYQINEISVNLNDLVGNPDPIDPDSVTEVITFLENTTRFLLRLKPERSPLTNEPMLGECWLRI